MPTSYPFDPRPSTWCGESVHLINFKRLFRVHLTKLRVYTATTKAIYEKARKENSILLNAREGARKSACREIIRGVANFFWGAQKYFSPSFSFVIRR